MAATGRNTPQRHQLRSGVQASAGGKGLKSTRGAYAGLAETFRNLKQYNGMRRRWVRTGLAPRARPTGQGNLPARRPWTCIRESSFRTATDWFPSRRLRLPHGAHGGEMYSRTKTNSSSRLRPGQLCARGEAGLLDCLERVLTRTWTQTLKRGSSDRGSVLAGAMGSSAGSRASRPSVEQGRGRRVCVW